MCRMLFYASKNYTTCIEGLAYLSWSKENNDGYGIYYRIKEKEELIKNEDITKFTIIDKPYNRLLIHFRNATQGKGLHPFISANKRFLLTHNGVITNYDQIKNTLKNHYFVTDIDSEVLLHKFEDIVYGKCAIENNNNKSWNIEHVKKYVKWLNNGEVRGLFNIIIYDRNEDKFLAIADSSLYLIKLKNGLIITSDLKPIPSFLNGIKEVINLGNNKFVYGRGIKYVIKTFKKYIHFYDIQYNDFSYLEKYYHYYI